MGACLHQTRRSSLDSGRRVGCEERCTSRWLRGPRPRGQRQEACQLCRGAAPAAAGHGGVELRNDGDPTGGDPVRTPGPPLMAAGSSGLRGRRGLPYSDTPSKRLFCQFRGPVPEAGCKSKVPIQPQPAQTDGHLRAPERCDNRKLTGSLAFLCGPEE